MVSANVLNGRLNLNRFSFATVTYDDDPYLKLRIDFVSYLGLQRLKKDYEKSCLPQDLVSWKAEGSVRC